MPRITLPVITSLDGHTVLQKPSGDISPYQGPGGDIDLLCGECHHMLAEHTYLDGIEGVVLRCPICEAYNLSGALQPGAAPLPDAGWQAIKSQDLRRP